MLLYADDIVFFSESAEGLQNGLHILKDYCYKWKLILFDFSLTVKAATLIFISECGSAIPSAKERKSGFIYNLVKS